MDGDTKLSHACLWCLDRFGWNLSSDLQIYRWRHWSVGTIVPGSLEALEALCHYLALYHTVSQ